MTSLTTPIRLSIVAPAFNEADGIEQLIHHWHAFLCHQSNISTFEIIICNDGSKDNTGPILDRLAVQYPELKPIHFKTNQGAAAALARAIAHTHFEWILLTDADDQFPIENLPLLINTMHLSGTLAVLSTRDKKDHWFARFGTKASGLICNIVHGSRLNDFNSAFKLVYGPIVRQLTLEAKGMNYSTEITSRLLEAKVPLIEVAVIHQSRQRGISKLRWFRDSFHRLLFVSYLSLRQLLLKLNILRPTNLDENPDYPPRAP